MAWDDTKQADDLIQSLEWNTMVADQKGHAVEHESGGRDAITHNSLSISTDDHHVRFGEDAADSVLDIPNRDVEDLTSQGASGTVPVSQGDGSILMQEISGGLETLADTETLIVYKESFNSFRNRGSWIEHIFNNEEEIADEITSNQVLNHYIFEAENDKYDRFIDPNHNLGLFKYNNSSEPTLSSIYEATMFLAPTSFYEGLLTVESIADTIANSSVLMDAVMTGDKILENQFGLEQSA